MTRKRYLGATDITALLGLSPYKSPLQLALEKKGRWEVKVNAAMTRGMALEPFVAAIAAERLGPLQKAGFVVHPEHDMLAASPDYLSDTALVELKTHAEHHRHRPHPIPADAVQVGWQRHLLRRAGVFDPQEQYVVIAWVAHGARVLKVKTADVPVGIVDVDFDTVEAMDDAMLTVEQVAVEWWHKYVIGDELPPADYRDTAVLQSLYAPTDRALEATDDVLQLVEELYHSHQRFQRIKREYETLQNRVKQALGECTWTETPHGVIRWSGVQRTEKRVDFERLKAEHPTAYLTCVAETHTTYRRLNLPKWDAEEDQ